MMQIKYVSRVYVPMPIRNTNPSPVPSQGSIMYRYPSRPAFMALPVLLRLLRRPKCVSASRNATPALGQM